MESSSYHHPQNLDLLGFITWIFWLKSLLSKMPKKSQTCRFRIFGWNPWQPKILPKNPCRKPWFEWQQKTPLKSTNKWLVAPKTSIPPSSIGKIHRIESSLHDSQFPLLRPKPWSHWFLGCKGRISLQPTPRTINLWADLSDLSDRTLVPETVSQLAVHYWHYLICLDISWYIHHISYSYTYSIQTSMCVFIHAWMLLSRLQEKLPIFLQGPFFSVCFHPWESTRCHYVDTLWASSSESGRRCTAVERFWKKWGRHRFEKKTSLLGCRGPHFLARENLTNQNHRNSAQKPWIFFCSYLKRQD